MVKFEQKVPRIFCTPMSYGEYLVKNPTIMPNSQISLDTQGYLIEEVDYGTEDQLPFIKGDWVDTDIIKKSFREIQ